MPDARLLVIDNAIDHTSYRPVEHWTAMVGFQPDAVHPPTGGTLPDVDSYSHVIISGCEGSVSDLAPWGEDEVSWVRQAIAAGAAVLGSCWGHQLIAFAMAGPQAVRRAATPECGWIDIPVGDSGELLPPESYQAFATHFDEVVPGCHPDLRVLAATPDCAVQAARWGDRPVWGIQAHPEMNPERSKEFLTECIERWPQSEAVFRRGLATPVRDSGHGRTIARRFLGA
jgi:GMP synthase-like glutamine amidotransferase